MKSLVNEKQDFENREELKKCSANLDFKIPTQATELLVFENDNLGTMKFSVLISVAVIKPVVKEKIEFEYPEKSKTIALLRIMHQETKSKYFLLDTLLQLHYFGFTA